MNNAQAIISLIESRLGIKFSDEQKRIIERLPDTGEMMMMATLNK